LRRRDVVRTQDGAGAADRDRAARTAPGGVSGAAPRSETGHTGRMRLPGGGAVPDAFGHPPTSDTAAPVAEPAAPRSATGRGGRGASRPVRLRGEIDLHQR